MFSSKHKGISSQTARVEVGHPAYLHSLYHHATTILGNVATFAKFATQMNLLSAVDERPTMNLNKWSLLRWFKKNKGKGKWAVVRPLVKEEHKASRIQHAQWILTLIAQGAAICYLDKMWYYLFSRQKSRSTYHKLSLKQKRQTESGLEG
jgi:hypothetical protein